MDADLIANVRKVLEHLAKSTGGSTTVNRLEVYNLGLTLLAVVEEQQQEIQEMKDRIGLLGHTVAEVELDLDSPIRQT